MTWRNNTLRFFYPGRAFQVWAAWNEGGFYVATRVTGKRRPLNCNPRKYWLSDHLRICLDNAIYSQEIIQKFM